MVSIDSIAVTGQRQPDPGPIVCIGTLPAEALTATLGENGRADSANAQVAAQVALIAAQLLERAEELADQLTAAMQAAVAPYQKGSSTSRPSEPPA
jgi:hypothetical protein